MTKQYRPPIEGTVHESTVTGESVRMDMRVTPSRPLTWFLYGGVAGLGFAIVHLIIWILEAII